LVLIANCASAAGATGHLFDPTLSLTGGTAVSTLDPVPDPGANHPAKPFDDPCGVAVDEYGDIYVANGATVSVGIEGRIDIFGPDGTFITEILNPTRPCELAVDPQGRLYVNVDSHGVLSILRYEPTRYEPATEEIAYGAAPTVFKESDVEKGAVHGAAVNPTDSHVFVARDFGFVEDLEEDGTVAGVLGDKSEMSNVTSVAVDGQTGDVLASGSPGNFANQLEARAFVLDGSTGKVKLTLDGAGTPDGKFGFQFGKSAVAIDEADGSLYVGDTETHHAVDQFDPSGHFVDQIKLGNNIINSEPFSAIAVDNGAHSPNQGYVYVTSGFQATNSHLFAFAPLKVQAPLVREVQALEVGLTEALLQAEVNPNGSETSYRFEYGPSDCAIGICAKTVSATLAAAGAFQLVQAGVEGLSPGTTYHFRLVATSNCNPSAPAASCEVSGSGGIFTTFPARPVQDCANERFRRGPSGQLPDCRAYELVTPSDTDGRVPTATVWGETRPSSPVLLAAADGESVAFATEGGALPGIGGGGFHDAYLARRGSDGWSTEFIGLGGQQAQEPYAAGLSADHGYSFWDVGGFKGSLVEGGLGGGFHRAFYLRRPTGAIEPVGIGSLGVDVTAQGRFISPGGGHVIFTSKRHLEPDAPPVGVEGIYDRLPGGSTRVVSLLPGNLPPALGAEFLGASADGSAVAFEVKEGSEPTIYLRRDDARTLRVASGNVVFAGLSEDGGRIFYLEEGDLFALDTVTGVVAEIGSGGETTVVNVAAAGSRAYFVSPVVLTGSERNQQGAEPSPGGENLYVWDAGSGAVRYVATVGEGDVVGEAPPVGGFERPIAGLGLWTSDAVAAETTQFVGPANDSSRTDPSGDVLVFQSHAKLTAYGNEGQAEVYRYDAIDGSLLCISCNPSGARPDGSARLESPYAPQLRSVPPVNAVSLIENISLGGRRIVFESSDALAPGDVDGVGDVYEWEAFGVGSCEEQAGCVQLISSGHGSRSSYLYGASADGRDVLFWTADQLVSRDVSTAPSIYDAREGGGFPEPAAPPPCRQDGCQGSSASGPSLATPASAAPAPSPRAHHRQRHRKHHRRHHRRRKGHHGNRARRKHRSGKSHPTVGNRHGRHGAGRGRR
jgi:hypothetical protein